MLKAIRQLVISLKGDHGNLSFYRRPALRQEPTQVMITAAILINPTNAQQGQTEQEMATGVFGLQCSSMASGRDDWSEAERSFDIHLNLLLRELEEDPSILSGLIMPSILIVMKVLSMLGCFLTFVLLHLSGLPTTPRLMIQKHRSFAMLLFYIFLFVDMNVIEVPCYLCLPSGVLAHYFGLAAYTWNLVEGMLLFKTIVQKKPMNTEGTHTAMIYMAITYGIPFVVVSSILLAVQFGVISLELVMPEEGMYPENCWFRSDVYGWGFIMPVAIMMCVNLSILALVVRTMNTRIPSSSGSLKKKAGNSVRHRIVRQDTTDSNSSGSWPIVVKHIRVLIILSFLLGLNGGITVVKLFDPHWAVYFVGACICSCTGIFFFVHSILLNNAVKVKLLSQWKRKMTSTQMSLSRGSKSSFDIKVTK